MPWISHDSVFDPDSLRCSLVGIAADLGPHDSGRHRHAMGQLLFARRGGIRVTLDRQLCLLPPQRLAWIPPRTLHRAEMMSNVEYRSVYLDEEHATGLPEAVAIWSVSPLLRELLERISTAGFDTDWSQGAPSRLWAVCRDELLAARRQPLTLSMPKDPRLQVLCSEHLPPPLEVLAARQGMSGKTIGRILRRETGLGYQAWRQQWRLLRAISLLAEGARTTDVAGALEFASDSAFVAFFRQMTGQAPRAYLMSHYDGA